MYKKVLLMSLITVLGASLFFIINKFFYQFPEGIVRFVKIIILIDIFILSFSMIKFSKGKKKDG